MYRFMIMQCDSLDVETFFPPGLAMCRPEKTGVFTSETSGKGP